MIRNEAIRYKILRNGIEFSEIYPANSAPTLRMASSGEIKVSLQGTFLQAGTENIDWLIDEIRPVLILDGIETPLATLMPSTVTPRTEETQKVIDIEAFDRCWKVRDNKVEGSIHLDQGDLYTTMAEELLVSSGVGLIIKTPSTATLTEDREDWKTGDSYLTIINDLLAEINYSPLWFDQNGNAMIQPIQNPLAENIKHTFTSKKTDPRNEKEAEIISIAPSMTRKMDIYSAPNVFICVCSNADKADGMVATAVNENMESPLSVPRRGRRIAKLVNLNNIASQAELEAYATKLLNESMFSGEEITITTRLLPGFGVDDVVAIATDDLFDICVESSWTMQLEAGGTMQHTLKRVVINLD